MKKDHGRTLESPTGTWGGGSGKPIQFSLLGPAESLPTNDSGPSHRVLLVEDQADVARATAMGLEFLGAIVCIAATGHTALELAVPFSPTLVLLDIDLPDLSGHEVARRLRRVPELAAVPLVALTSWNTAEMRQRSADAGMVEHLAKPLDLDSLAALLARTPVPPR